MIQDSETNMVYLAQGLSHYAPVCRNLLEALHRERIHAEFLPFTSSYKHVWARDYMPIQLQKNQFFFYAYRPDYLVGYHGYIPDVHAIVDELHLVRYPVDIVLDGGNAVPCGDKVIMTDKIFRENPSLDRNKLLATLEDCLEAQVVLIPRDPYDMFGHADGMVRWIEGDRVLLNNYVNTDPGLRKKLLEALSPHFVVEELEFGSPRPGKLSWAYLNFLRVGNSIFVPGLHSLEDPMALQQLQRFYPHCTVIQVQGCEAPARHGGALHCLTWNLLAALPAWPQEDA